MNFPDALQHKQTTFYKGILFSIGLIITSILFFIPNTSHSQQQINWLNYPDSNGFAYIQYTGEKEISSQELLTLIKNQGCTLRVLWIKEQRIGYHKDAIEAGVDTLINKPFYDSTIQTDTKMTIHCIPEESTIQQPIINETHIRWVTYPEINTNRNKQGQATIQYGGGSFYQLVSRLSTQGCNVHTLSIYNQEKKQTYTYSFENTNEQNQEFTNNYKQHIPKDTNITITCVDNCTIIYGLDLAEDPRERQRIQNIEKCDDDVSLLNEFFTEVYGTNLDSYTECTDNWSEGARQFFSMVPVFQDICKIEVFLQEGDGSGFFGEGMSFQGSTTSPGRALYQYFVPSIIVGLDKDPSQRLTDTDLLLIEFHELCHAHQSWYMFKEYVDYDYLRHSWHQGPTSLWHETPMAQEFNGIVGFKQNANGDWYIEDSNSIFNREFSSYYNTNPEELSVQLCNVYLLEKIQPNNNEYSKYAQSPYITPQIEQWIEKYIVLPE